VRGQLLMIFGAVTALLGCSNSNEAGPAVAVDPAALYSQMCARCHGADGRGDPEMKKIMPAIRDFSEPQFRARNPDEVEQVIMGGREQMPGFGGALSQTKIKHLAGYVRQLGAVASAGQNAPK
jgi:mono/diheme cytochrome c family protein